MPVHPGDVLCGHRASACPGPALLSWKSEVPVRPAALGDNSTDAGNRALSVLTASSRPRQLAPKGRVLCPETRPQPHPVLPLGRGNGKFVSF